MAEQYEPTPGIAGSALVLVEDQRAALAAVLIAQELGYSVDIAANPQAALSWIQLARYELIVCSGGEQSRSPEFILRLRYTAPHSRIVLLGGADGPIDALAELDVDVLRAPVDVNRFMTTLWRDAA
jgi:CheY-like chemotaxis protein